MGTRWRVLRSLAANPRVLEAGPRLDLFLLDYVRKFPVRMPDTSTSTTGPLPPDPNAPAPGGLGERIEAWPYNSAALFLFLGLVLLTLGVGLGIIEYLYRTQARTTQAVVVRAWGTGTKATATYRFTLPGDREITGTQGNFRPKRDVIRIEYVPAHPRLNRVAYADDPREHRAFGTLGLIGLLLCAFGVHLVRQVRRGVARPGLFAPPPTG